MGLPTSATVTARSSSMCAAHAACSCSRPRRRSSGSVDQVVSSKARRAAPMADAMSCAVPSAVSPNTSSVVGSMLSKVAPELDSTSLPSMSRRDSPRTS